MQRTNPAVTITMWISLLVLILPASSLATITFERTYDYADFDAGHCVRQTTDGGYIIAGQTVVVDYFDDYSMLLIKVDSLGNETWHRTYGHHLAGASCVLQTPDTGYVLAGCINAITVIKTDPFGNVQWGRGYGGLAAHSIWQTVDGGFIIAASTWPGYIYLIKTDQLGGTTWSSNCGIPYRAVGNSVQQTPDGGYILGGYRRQDDERDWDIYLVRTNSLGDTVWTRTYGGEADDRGFSVDQTSDGAYVIAGYTKSFSVGATDAYLAKVHSSGLCLWTRTYGGMDFEMAHSVQQTSDGGFILAGYASTGLYLVRTDPLGYQLWSRTYGSSGDRGWSVQQTFDGGYIIAGYKDSEVYLIKTNAEGLLGIEEDNREQKRHRSGFELLQNHPNPFYSSTMISYSLSAAAQVTLRVFDIGGRLVETLVDEIRAPGDYQIRWEREDNPSGVYFYRLRPGDFVCTKKMVVLD